MLIPLKFLPFLLFPFPLLLPSPLLLLKTGVALFHCHIGWHQVQGLLAVLVSQPDRIRDFNIPADNLAVSPFLFSLLFLVTGLTLALPCQLCNGGNVSQVDPGRKRALPESPVPTRLTVKPRRRWNYWCVHFLSLSLLYTL